MGLRVEDWRAHVGVILDAVRRGSDPRACTAQAVTRDPPRMSRPAVIAVGKAAPAMLEGFRDAFGRSYDAVMVVPEGTAAPAWAIRADHPVPTARCVEASERIAAFVQAVTSGATGNDGFVVLLSGGASALLTWPAAEIPLKRYAAAMEELLRWGVEIGVLNAIRKHCERLKGGRLAAMMAPLPCATYVLSDVIGDELSTVGSGPTVPDPTTFEDALRPFDLELEFSQAAEVVGAYLRDGAMGKHPESPKPGDPLFAQMRAVLVGSNALAVEAAAESARQMGFGVRVRTGVTGEAAAAGRALVAEAREAGAPAAVVYGGETTVRAGKKGGRGGRNQELALAAAMEIEGAAMVVAAYATDGVDGPTDAAGAMVTGETCARARDMKLDPADFLARHDSYGFFEALERGGWPHLMRTGPTGTNVNDVAVALAY